jgi:hypothetical protein
MTRVAPLAACVATLVLGWPPLSFAAEPLPFEISLPLTPVTIELDDARVVVVYKSDSEALIRATAPSAAGAGTIALELDQADGGVFVRRPDREDGSPIAGVTLDLVLDPSQRLAVFGDDLSIAVEGIPLQEEEAVPGPSAAGSARETSLIGSGISALEFQVSNSEIDLVNASDVSVIARDSGLHSESSTGSMTLQLNHGTALIRGHEGHVGLSSVDAQVTVRDIDGTLAVTLTDGILELRSGGANLEGTVQGGSIAVANWDGRITLEANDATLSLRDSRLFNLRVTGSDSSLSMNELQASASIEFGGGDFSAEDGQGKLDLRTTEGTRVSIDNHRGPLALCLKGDSTARLSELAGPVKTELENSEIDLRGPATLEMSAIDSRIVVAEGVEITAFQALRCDVELDLRARTGRMLDLPIGEHTHATVYLPAPCSVRVRGPASTGSQVDVTGCELQFQNTGRWAGRRTLDMDGRRPFQLRAELAETATLRVQGGL